jgi:hypothetical protein
MLRSVLAVVAGYLVFGLSAALLFPLSGRDARAFPQTGFLVFSTVYGMAFALLGGYVAASLARRKEIAHAAVVAGIIAVLALISLVAKSSGSLWSQIAAIVLMAPAALLGGWLRARRTRPRP